MPWAPIATRLVRVLRGLVIEGVLSEEDDGRFALTPVGESLTSLRGAAIVRGELYYGSAAGLLDTVLGRGTAFERIHGARFFDHLADHPDHEAAFQASMAGRAEQEASAVVETFDFSGIEQLVDVGGGGGILLAAILAAHPATFAACCSTAPRRSPAPETGWSPPVSPIAPIV